MQVLPAPDRVTIVTVPTPPQSACALCGGLSGRVHSYYTSPWPTCPGAVGQVGAVVTDGQTPIGIVENRDSLARQSPTRSEPSA